MATRPRGRRLILGLTAVALIAVACSSSKKSSSTNTTTGGGAVKQGGDVTFSAEQEPDCMDWIGT